MDIADLACCAARQLHLGHGTVSLGTSLAQVRWDGTDGIGDDSELSWAFVGGGRWFLDTEQRNYLGFGGSFGDGQTGNQINLIYHFAPEFLIGGEYVIAQRENTNGADGTAQRIQFSTMYSF